MRSLILLTLFILFVNGVFADKSKVVGSVIVGDSFTLHTDLTQIYSGNVIDWRFKNELIARVTKSNETHVLVNIDRHLPEVNNHTGDLKITNVRSTDCGSYELMINNDRGISWKSFDVTCVSEPSDGVKVVSVLDRDSVILPTGLHNITRDDRVTWRFEGTIIAQTNKTGFLKGRRGHFKDRLHINKDTGSLTITNVRSRTSGVYELDICKRNTRFTTHKKFQVTAIDVEETQTVTEGISVTLQSGIEIHKDDVITWRFEHEDSIIASISNGSFSTSDGADGRFTSSLELDHKTGSLTIRNIKNKHSGLYHLDITGNRRTIFKRFSLSVCSKNWSPCVFALIAACLLLLVVVGVVAVISVKKI